MASGAALLKDDIASVERCTNGTLQILESLLGQSKLLPPSKPSIQTVGGDASARKRRTALSEKPQKGPKSAATPKALPENERLKLATEVVNITLKLFTDAIRTRNQCKSTSHPTKPAAQASRESNLENVVLCARAAFAFLRRAHDAKGSDRSYKVEAGVSAFVGKLIALGIFNSAASELRTLVDRLLVRDAGENCRIRTAKSQSLSQMLDIEILPKDKEASNLLAASHIHCLKILAHSKPAEAQSALKFFQSTKVTGPSHLISQCLEHGHMTASEARKGFRNLLQCLAEFGDRAPSHRKQPTGDEIDIAAKVKLHYRIASLTTILHANRLLGQETDFANDILIPLGKYIRAFSRDSANEKQALDPDLMALVYDLDQTCPAQTVTTTKGADQLKQVIRMKSSLVLLAMKCARQTDVDQHFRSALAIFTNSALSDSQRTQVLCELCLDGMESSVSAQIIEPELSNVATLLISPMKVSLRDLDDTLITTSSLRRRIVDRMRILLAAATQDPPQQYSERMDTHFRVLSSIARFTLQYLQNSQRKDDPVDEARMRQCASMVNRIARPTIDGVFMLVRVAIAAGKDDDRFSSSLRVCATILAELDTAVLNGHLLALDERLAGIHVKLSDQLSNLSQGSRIRAHSTPTMLEILQISTNVLSKVSVQEQIEGRYAEKLCKLIRAYDSAASHTAAFQTLQSLANFCAVSEILHKAVYHNTPTDVPSHDVALADSTIQRMAATFVRIAKPAQAETLAALFILTNEGHAANVCGYLAECEMAAMISVLQAGGKISGDVMKPAAEALDIWYPRDRHPVRRLRVITWVLQVAKFWPQDSGIELVASCETELERFDLHDLAEDAQLADQTSLLLSLAHISVAYSGEHLQLESIRCGLESWYRVLGKRGKQLPPSLKRLLLVWPQMISLANYLYAHSLWEDYLATLRVLELLCKGGLSEGRDAECAILIRSVEAKFHLGQLHECRKLLETSSHIVEKASSALRAFAETIKAWLFRELGNTEEASATLKTAVKSFAAVETPNIAGGAFDVHPGHNVTAAVLLGTVADQHQSAGSSSKALFFARAGARMATLAWRVALKQSKAKIVTDKEDKQDDSITEESSDMKASRIQDDVAVVAVAANSLFSTAVELIASLTRLSQRLADAGIIQEARQYLRQAERVANAVKLKRHMKRLSLISAGFSILEGQFEHGAHVLETVIRGLGKQDVFRLEAEIELCRALWLAGDVETAKNQLSEVAKALSDLAKPVHISQDADTVGLLEQELKHLKISKTRAVASSYAKPSKSARTRQVAAVPKGVPGTVNDGLNTAHRRLDTHVKVLQVSMALPEHDFPFMWALLDSVSTVGPRVEETIIISVLKSKVHFQEAMDTLALDPIYNSLNDAPLAFPAKVNKITTKAAGTDTTKSSTRQKRALTKASVKKESSESDSVVCTTMPQKSLQALEDSSRCMSDIVALARDGASTHVVHDMAYNLSKVSMFLSATETTGALHDLSCILAGAMEIGRGSTALRQTQMAAAEELLSRHDEKSLLDPRFHEEEAMAASTPLPENFRENYVDILPSTWTVISLSLSNDGRELQLSRLRRNASPFVLALPLGRNFDGIDEDDLSFDMAKGEMADIVKLANFSAHDTTNLTKKGAKTEWWNTRKALDERLEQLLFSMDKTWLGGFAGLFSQREIIQKAFTAFADRFLKILDKHLPSRSQRAGSPKTERVSIDKHIMEIFIGLGLPAEEGDLDEALLDLLAFIVDILQFNGERNAFDEIDFDAMVLETLDALGQYHQAAERHKTSTEDDSHLILILDKHLHCFPWESLPCLQGASVSRLPSLEMLRQRIIASNDSSDSSPSTPTVSRDSGASILNPGGDLIHTESVFSSPLSQLPSTWTQLTRRAPSEPELASLLASNSLYIYLGHGSGGQYIRSRTIRKLKTCAVSLLLGCSSATMTEAGQFESYGTPLTYLQGGAPAVVGTLWDVTDKDIDRFSMKMLTRWGLFDGDDGPESEEKLKKPGPKTARGRKKDQKDSVKSKPAVALDRAVSEARGECLMRYLNGAAPVVYGVPVTLT